ncbi:MAG: glycerol-3-phosphate 1-O-acyltransferase PlsY [Candidatus Aegiribacteria sp.]|nr:glycerol-3-phosphate 1-O-acyltransferase PlsY [Candidatus Aegiribacteria sp.]
MTLWHVLFYLLLGFLSGSVPWSWLLGRLKGVDIQSKGSGNTGATNLMRVCGTGYGTAGLFLDAVKGALPVFVAANGLLNIPPASDLVVALVAICAVLGHVYTPWLGFNGGKGVATALGVLLVLSPLSVATAVGVFVLILLLTRYVSLSSICAAVCMIPAVFLFDPGKVPVQAVMSLVAFLIIIRHRPNIKRLLRGEESRFSFHRRQVSD